MALRTIFSFVSALVLSPSNGIERAPPWVSSHKLSGIGFPHRLGDFVADSGGPHFYNASRTDVSLGYTDSRGASLTVYVYPREGLGVEDEFREVGQHVLRAHQHVRPVKTGAAHLQGVRGLELWLEGDRAVGSGIAKLSTTVQVFAYGSWFVKLRASFPGQAAARIAAFDAVSRDWRWPVSETEVYSL
jgi:hypothetical protein